MFRLVLAFLVLFASARLEAQTVQVWLTTEDLRSRLEERSVPLVKNLKNSINSTTRIELNPAITFQTMLGMGSSLEQSTCSNLFRLAPETREQVIARLVSPTAGIGMNLMRICIGTSDFAGDDWYSYDDLPKGETDPELKRFSNARDRACILPVLKSAKKINPDLLFLRRLGVLQVG
jgi:glucosylceramidase